MDIAHRMLLYGNVNPLRAVTISVTDTDHLTVLQRLNTVYRRNNFVSCFDQCRPDNFRVELTEYIDRQMKMVLRIVKMKSRITYIMPTIDMPCEVTDSK